MVVTRSKSRAKADLLAGVPAEIRLRIYSYLITEACIVITNRYPFHDEDSTGSRKSVHQFKFTTQGLAIVRTCQYIRQEFSWYLAHHVTLQADFRAIEPAWWPDKPRMSNDTNSNEGLGMPSWFQTAYLPTVRHLVIALDEDTSNVLTLTQNCSWFNQWSADKIQTPGLAKLLPKLATLRFVHQGYSLGPQLQRSDRQSVAVRINIKDTPTKSPPAFLEHVATVLHHPAPTVHHEDRAFKSKMESVLMLHEAMVSKQASSLAKLRHLIETQELRCRVLYTFRFLVTWDVLGEGHGHPGVHLDITVDVRNGAITEKKVYDRAGRSLNTRASLLELMSRDFRSAYSLYLKFLREIYPDYNISEYLVFDTNEKSFSFPLHEKYRYHGAPFSTAIYECAMAEFLTLCFKPGTKHPGFPTMAQFEERCVRRSYYQRITGGKLAPGRYGNVRDSGTLPPDLPAGDYACMNWGIFPDGATRPPPPWMHPVVLRSNSVARLTDV